MKISPCNWRSGRFFAYRFLILIFGWALVTFSSSMLLAVDKAPGADSTDEKKVHVSADRLVVKSKSNMAEFIGNVHVTQGKTAVKADRITIYSKQAPKGTDSAKPGMESIDRIIAKGNVEVTLDDGTAVTDQAEYQADKRIMILSGPGSKVTKGGNSISGSKITLYRDDGRINVDSSDRQRVKAVFVSEERLIE